MNELEQITSKLKRGNNGLYYCPAHDDQKASLSIDYRDGKILLHCYAGCSFEKIIKAIGISRTSQAQAQNIKEIYNYQDENGNLLYQVIRYEPKSFKQRRPNGNGWAWNINGIEPVLYHLPEIIEDIKQGKVIYIVEGEKDADRLRKEGLAATTISGGASQKWKPQYTFTLRGATVRIIPDNDEAGLSFVRRIATQLFGWAKSVKILSLPGLKGNDVSDWLDEGHTTRELELLDAPEFIPTGPVSREEFMELRGYLVYIYNKLHQHIEASRKLQRGRWIK